MEIVILPTPDAVSVLAARIVARLVRAKPNAVLGLATGSTPVAMYRELIRIHREEALDFSSVTAFNLDEYVGLGPSHPASYQCFMRENLFDQINIRPELTHIPDGLAADVPASCLEYEDKIRNAGGIDLQVLGIGSDGHIGFNEPISSLTSRTRIKTLTPRTRLDNARFFSRAEDVPHHVITMGIGTIMEAREILLLGFGSGKADALSAAIEGPLSANVPASILQMHPRAQVLMDEAAGEKLERREYYRYVFENKPEWQRVGMEKGQG